MRYRSKTERTSSHERMRARIEAESEYAKTMDQHILTEAASIRAEWTDEERERRTVGRKVTEVGIPSRCEGRGRWNGNVIS